MEDNKRFIISHMTDYSSCSNTLKDVLNIEDRIVCMSNGMKTEISNRRFAEFKQVVFEKKIEEQINEKMYISPL